MKTEWTKVLGKILNLNRNPRIYTMLLMYFPPKSCSKIAKVGVLVTLIVLKGMTWAGLYKISELVFH